MLGKVMRSSFNSVLFLFFFQHIFHDPPIVGFPVDFWSFLGLGWWCLADAGWEGAIQRWMCCGWATWHIQASHSLKPWAKSEINIGMIQGAQGKEYPESEQKGSWGFWDPGHTDEHRQDLVVLQVHWFWKCPILRHRVSFWQAFHLRKPSMQHHTTMTITHQLKVTKGIIQTY